MHLDFSLLWTWHRTIDRVPYLLTGALLFVVKFAIDWTIATQAFGQSWSPLNYLVWPNDRVLRVFDLAAPERWFAVTMLLVSLPFIWTGVLLTLHRLRAAGLPLGLIVFFFVPLVNLLLFLVLVLLPTQRALSVVAVPQPAPGPDAPLRRVHRRLAGDSYWQSGLVALAITVPLAVLAVVLGAHVLQSYGFSLFIGAPFVLGMFSVLLFGFSRPQPLPECLRVALAALGLAGLAILAFALEGIICLLMAAPIALVLTILGALVGYVIQARPWLNDQTGSILLALLAAVPALMAAESVHEHEERPPVPDRLETVTSTVALDANSEQVWDMLLVVDALSGEKPFLLRIGLPLPERCTLDGVGIGATRTCHFHSGVIEERVTRWEPAHRLDLQVVRATLPGRHWLKFERASFVLDVLSPNKTRVTRTTTISSKLRPAWYWRYFEAMGIGAEHDYLLRSLEASTKRK
jgi:hypothetical protein